MKIKEQFDLAGFRPGAPCPEAAAIDRAIANESDCGDCGRRGMLYLPFTHTTRGTYRAFAKCTHCGNTEEF